MRAAVRIPRDRKRRADDIKGVLLIVGSFLSLAGWFYAMSIGAIR